MKQTNQQKSEIEWIKEFEEEFKHFYHPSHEPESVAAKFVLQANQAQEVRVKSFIRQLLAQSRQQIVGESKERKSCPDCGDIYTCSCFNPNSPKYKTKLT